MSWANAIYFSGGVAIGGGISSFAWALRFFRLRKQLAGEE